AGGLRHRRPRIRAADTPARDAAAARRGHMKYAHGMPFGAEVVPDGVRFRVWAPAARAARVWLDGRSRAMEGTDRGFFELTDVSAGPGSRYAFTFDDGDLRVPDPASRCNPDDVHGPSEV